LIKLPSVSGRECLRALEKAGFRVIRQEGSHVVARRDAPFARLVVPDHRELELSAGSGSSATTVRSAAAASARVVERAVDPDAGRARAGGLATPRGTSHLLFDGTQAVP
jgi:predicted RNA binding protein YcfA (HicA-like mRNA interferase family)